ncbi:MBL fold metallo-hydrolase [Chitinophagaceae bacterium LB-8]|uniref:MBL fold metallo-hydrolase n=1 Tax=Paraflavisolibacter caeni TaxID=2982496 RepID=A0A9X2XW04_9BACT|nr:MBL fold metallo-hydrolase [Paraflavisolibacter caeni]MCU7550065.1 MBL fold metallo-hydrolase [Paraflavisolibacter caeni]
MNITIWGVRGSIPTIGPDTNEYGGNTSCIEVEANGWLLVLDAGSGIQYVNHSQNLKRGRVDILLTHLHMDHIQGLGFFRPLFDPSMEVHIWGPASNDSLRYRLGRYFSPPLFPVHFRDLPCKLTLHEIDNSSFQIGPFEIQSRYVTHPGPTIGFRIKNEHSVFAYIPDHEPALGPTGMPHDVKWLSGSDLALGADLLLHDGQYTVDEYKHRIGWGHSSIEDAVEFAALTGVKRLILSHHDPMHTDKKLHEIFNHLKEKNTYPFPFELAIEGLQVKL